MGKANIPSRLQPKSPSPMRKTIRRVLPKNEKQYQHDWHITNRQRQPSFDSDRECPADRILGNQAMMQQLSLKVETEGEKATATFLESLGCSDVEGVLRQIENPWPFDY
jgi:hypothetical protein